MNAARTVGAFLVLAGIALAGPQFRIGTKLTWRGDAGSSGLAYDRFGEPLVMVNYEREFLGATAEIVYGPVWNVLSGRIDLYQISVYPDDAFIVFSLLPMLGLDLMAAPPVDWRLKPYIWTGARAAISNAIYAPHTFEIPHGLGTHWVGGLGATFKLTKRIDLFGEAQLYSSDIWRDGGWITHDGAFVSRLSGTEVSGVVGAEIGARFALGK
jgi:hypothetical protein